jgi:hypothetical protein
LLQLSNAAYAYRHISVFPYSRRTNHGKTFTTIYIDFRVLLQGHVVGNFT